MPTALSGRKIAAFVQQGKQVIHRDYETEPQVDEDEDVDPDELPTDEELLEEVEDQLEDGTDLDDELETLMGAYDSERGKPDWAIDEEEWDRAVELVEPDGDGMEKFAEPWKAVAYLYKKLGGTVQAEPEEDD